MSTWSDFNNAEDAHGGALIPKGALVKVRMTLRPGGYDDPAQGWTGGYATRSTDTGAVYLDAEFVVLGGEFARRKLWSLIGLASPKGPTWANMGRTLIKGLLNSARGVAPMDLGPAAQQARRIAGFADLDGIEFVAKVDWEKDRDGQDKAVIKTAITSEHPDYAALMGGTVSHPASATSATTSPARSPVPGRPSWAQ